jgi:hypothetical protein
MRVWSAMLVDAVAVATLVGGLHVAIYALSEVAVPTEVAVARRGVPSEKSTTWHLEGHTPFHFLKAKRLIPSEQPDSHATR